MCRGKDIEAGHVFSVLTMDFDYTRKDLRQRRYAMESREEAEVRFIQRIVVIRLVLFFGTEPSFWWLNLNLDRIATGSFTKGV